VLCALASALFLAVGLAGCTTARSSLGTSDDPCYLALPTANSAVHSRGRLIGVHLFDLKTLHQRAPALLSDLDTKDTSSQSVCVSAFVGHFTRASVTGGRGRSSGKVAIVVSTTTGNHVLGTVLFDRTPLHFGHPHVG
jgi:hypothetical protein